MMSISSVVTRGYGSWGSVNKLPTWGFSIGVPIIQATDGQAFAVYPFQQGAAAVYPFQRGAFAVEPFQQGGILEKAYKQ